MLSLKKLHAKQILLLSFLILGSCKKSSHEGGSSNAALVGTSAQKQTQTSSLYATGIALGVADFVVLRDCDASNKCTNDILTSQDDLIGDTEMMSISIKGANDPGSMQVIACEQKAKFQPSHVTIPPSGVTQITTDVTLQNTVYTCLLQKYPKSRLLSGSESSQSTALALAENVSTNSKTSSRLSSTQTALIGAAAGWAVGSFAVMAMYAVPTTVDIMNYRNILNKITGTPPTGGRTYDKIFMTDFDGTLGMGDFEPHKYGSVDVLNEHVNTLGQKGHLNQSEWEDFCKRKIGGTQGMKEFKKKFAVDGYITVDGEKISVDKITATQIVEAGLIPELQQLKGYSKNNLPNFQFLAANGHMVIHDGHYYNAPTWLEGATESLRGHIDAGHLVMFNSTNPRPEVASLIEASLAQKIGENKAPRYEAGKRGSSTLTRWENVFIGTAAAIGVHPTENAIVGGTSVIANGDKTAIAQKMLKDAYEARARLSENPRMICLDDKPDKDPKFDAFAEDIRARNVVIRSRAVSVIDSNSKVTNTDHIAASNSSAFEEAKFQGITPGHSYVIEDASIIRTNSNTPFHDSTLGSKKYSSPFKGALPKGVLPSHLAKGGFGAALLGGVLAGVGAAVGSSFGHE